MRLGLAAAIVALSLPLGASAERALGVDWTARVLRVKGAAAPNTAKSANVAAARIGAERAAKVDAIRNALEQLRGVQVTTGSAAGQLLDDAATRARAESVVRGLRVVDTKYFEDGGVEVFLEVPLDGALGESLAPPAGGKTPPAAGAATHTGLVVLARGVGVTPALSPRLVDETGQELYGASFVRREALRTRGIASFMKDAESARRSERAGANPLELKALRAQGSDVVLAKADADRLRDAKSNLSFLAEGQVVIVTD